MTLEIAELNLQGVSREQRTVAVAASVASELNIRTQEGDLVSLSFASEQSLEQSRTQIRSPEFGSIQEFSSVARAASSYSITVQGDLNEEELAAINKLAAEIAPMAQEFFANGGFDFENSADVLASNLGVIQEVELSLERTITAAFEFRSFSNLPEADSELSPEDVEAVLNNPAPELDTGAIRDFPALVQATFDAVFEAETAKFPDTDPILRSLNDLLDFIRKQLGEFFGPENVELPPEIPAPLDGAVDIVEPSPPASA